MKSLLCLALAVVLCLFSTSVVRADIPVHCLDEQIYGLWEFSLGGAGYDNTLDCTSFSLRKTAKFLLQKPNKVVDTSGKIGTWTLIYDEGMEIIIDNVKYFAFYQYKQTRGGYESYCNITQNGWYHDTTTPGVIPKNWGCFSGKKLDQYGNEYSFNAADESSSTFMGKTFESDQEYADKLNAMQNSWTAGVPTENVGKKIYDVLYNTGRVIPEYKKAGRKKAVPRSAEDDKFISTLPDNFDWRNVSGVNYDSPVRDQSSCGSCYIHAAVEMIEARTRIATNNKDQVILSPQIVVSCSNYSQGCDGGFTYLVSKFGEDFGLVTESCFPYKARYTACTPCKDITQRRYVTRYSLIGDYYGNCTEAAMMKEIYENGPIAVAFMVFQDFPYYKGGIYHHQASGVKSVNGWVEVNHEVVIVGWGVEPKTGEKYWTVKNSWSESWGLNGYFMIRRGTDECGIESLAYSAFPVL